MQQQLGEELKSREAAHEARMRELRLAFDEQKAEIAALEKQGDNLLVYAPTGGRVVDMTLVKGDQMALGSKVAGSTMLMGK
mgnify:CR=1 FL=1